MTRKVPASVLAMNCISDTGYTRIWSWAPSRRRLKLLFKDFTYFLAWSLRFTLTHPPLYLKKKKTQKKQKLNKQTKKTVRGCLKCEQKRGLSGAGEAGVRARAPGPRPRWAQRPGCGRAGNVRASSSGERRGRGRPGSREGNQSP